MMRTEDAVEFNDDVLSWQSINGDIDPFFCRQFLLQIDILLLSEIILEVHAENKNRTA